MNLFKRKPSPAGKKGFLQRLAKDVAGNTAAIMAAALLPLAGFTGAALDTARLYVVKVRLQQACDAGVLAGRKMMTGTAMDDASKASANTFFANNFRQGWFTSKAVSFTPSDTSDGQVQGTATATVPATLMTMFGAGDTKLTVNCEARKEIGDVDVMFVLDTTGSMVCNTSESSCTQTKVAVSTPSGTRYYLQEKSDSKIKALRTAVMTFYDTLAASADPSSRIRYGFVPYSSSANVGTLLPASYISDTVSYPSRKIVGDYVASSSNSTTTSTSKATCDGRAQSRNPSTGFPATQKTTSWSSSNSGTCTTTTQTLTPMWRYDSVDLDTSQYKLGSTVTNPTRVDGATSVWDGCVVERDTTGSSSFSQSSLPPDLDIDLAPTNAATRWRPAWIDVVYDRPNLASDDSGLDTWPGSTNNSLRSRYLENATPDGLLKNGYYVCPKKAQRLAIMTRSDVSNYVNASDFKAIGGTYHDAGMIWGARFLSPTGLFKNDTDCRANRTCGRHIILMTDGAMAPNLCVYGFQGLERIEGRVTGSKPVGTCNSASSQFYVTGQPSDLDDRHNARLQAICTQAKNKGITIWVVAYAQTLTDDMKNCASNSDTAIYAPTDQKLQDAFKQIAGKIAELRISK